MAATWELVSEAEQRANFEAARDILTCPSPEGGEAATVGRALLMVTGARSAAILFRAHSGGVTCPWSHNLSDAYVLQLITPEGVNPWTHVMRTPELTCLDMEKRAEVYRSRPWFLRDVCELPRRNTVRRRLEGEGLRSICTWPLCSAGQVIGAVASYYDVAHTHTAPEEAMMRAFISDAATVVSRTSAMHRRGEDGPSAAEFRGARPLDLASRRWADVQNRPDPQAAGVREA
jgi:hypothetical protein